MSDTVLEEAAVEVEAPAEASVEVPVEATEEVVEETTPVLDGLQDVPGRVELTSRLTDLLLGGRNIGDLAPHEVLQVPEDMIAELKRFDTQKIPVLEAQYSSSRSMLEMQVEKGEYLTVAGQGSRANVQEALEPLFRDQKIYSVIEAIKFPGDKRVLRDIPAEMIAIQFTDDVNDSADINYVPNVAGYEVLKDDGTTADSVTFKEPAADKYQMFIDHPNWTNIDVSWHDKPVAFVKNDGHTLFIAASLFLTSNGRFTRTSSDFPQRIAAFKEILALALPHMPNVFKGSQPSFDPDILRKAIAEFESIRTLAMSRLQGIEDETRKIKSDLNDIQQQYESSMRSLIQLGRTEVDLRDRYEALANNQGSRAVEAINQAFRSLDHILGLNPIKNAEFTYENNAPKLKVETYGRVIEDPTGRHSTKRHYLKPMHFTIDLSNNSRSVLNWDMTKGHGPNGDVVHPHVNRSGNTCWGGAEAPVADAFTRRDWASFVQILLGWAGLYDANSPWVQLTDFPETELPVGWVYDETAVN